MELIRRGLGGLVDSNFGCGHLLCDYVRLQVKSHPWLIENKLIISQLENGSGCKGCGMSWCSFVFPWSVAGGRTGMISLALP